MWSSPPGLFRLGPTLAPHRPRTCNMRDLLKISELGAEAPEVSPWLEHDVPQRVELLLADQDPEGLSELGALGRSEEIKRQEERRGGKECVSRCRSRWSR